MMRNIKSNNKKNNKGFTLVEVLIAMSVLVIVSIPMLDTLSGTSTMTRKSSTRQRATLLGQSITEGIKRYSTIDLCRAFIASGGASRYDDCLAFPILNRDNYDFQDFARLDKNVDRSGNVTYSVNTTESENAKEYYFGIFGIEEGIETYDALITLTPDTYEDLNAEVIPEIVNIGAPGTGLIDITGVYNGKDLISEFIDKVESDEYSPVVSFDPDKVELDVDIVITKHESTASVSEKMYEIYGSVWYRYDRNGDGDTNDAGDVNVGSSYLGSRSLDALQGLNYVYVLLGDDNLARYVEKHYDLDFQINIAETSDAENIPIAIVTGNNSKVKWDMSVTSKMPDPSGGTGYVYTDDWKNTATFFTNATGNKIKGRSVDLKDYATSGNKLKRIYGLTVDMYPFNFAVDRKFQGDPIDSVSSSYLRIDVEDFNSETSKAE